MPVFKSSYKPSRTLRPLVIVGGLVVMITLSSCGIKPDNLSPPGGATAPSFPAPYPR